MCTKTINKGVVIMNEKIVKAGKNETEEADRNKVIKIVIKYMKKLSDSDLDKILEYLNYLIAN